MYILGFDIGGTKCAVLTAEWDGTRVTILKKEICATDHKIGAHTMLKRLIAMGDALLDRPPDRIGISCGGPLDSARGVIMSPPNLPGWDHIAVTDLLSLHFDAPAYLQNDANACAIAEWKFGAGRGCHNMIFLTFGTGLGAGIIANGALLAGACGNAGEVGHVRIAEDGPVGYGKAGSLEGFCSGGGIARLAILLARERMTQGEPPMYLADGESEETVSALTVAEAARRGDPTARRVYALSGRYLGRGLAMLIDILNPERIVLGGVFARSGDLLITAMQEELAKEALAPSCAVCQIQPAALGDAIGDYGAIAAALIE